MHRTRRRLIAVAVLTLAGITAAGCVPSAQSSSSPAPPPRPAMIDLSAAPTIAEYVETNLAYQGDRAAVLWLIHDTFGDRPDLEWCFAAPNKQGIVDRESGYGTFAHNPSGASGLTQQIGHADVYAALGFPYDPFNPLYNLRVARSMAETRAGLVSGWQPLPSAC